MTRQERVQVRCFDRGEVVEAAHLDGAFGAMVDHGRQRHGRNGQKVRKDRPMTIPVDLRGDDPRLRVGGRNAGRTP
jgi:hypothetical protein